MLLVYALTTIGSAVGAPNDKHDVGPENRLNAQRRNQQCRAQACADLILTGQISVYGVLKACEFLRMRGFLRPINGNSNDF
jgi:hypothetical protein